MPKPNVEWCAEPPQAGKLPHIQIVRCGATTSQTYLVTSDKLIGSQLYWMTGRSCPHLKEDCPGCEANKEHRWNGWLAVFDEHTLKPVILEVTPNCVGQINDAIVNFGTLRGLRITLHRKSKRFNGALSATLVPSGLPMQGIPITFDLTEYLHQMWAAPSKNSKVSLESPRVVDEKKGRDLLKTAKVTKTYEATDEQKLMLEANKKTFQEEIQAAKKRIKPGMTERQIYNLGIRKDLARALAKADQLNTQAKTNGRKH